MTDRVWLRRARPFLGTLVDVGVPEGHDAAVQAAFAVMAQVQACMSIHDQDSDLSRSHAAQVGQFTPLHPWTADVLLMAQALYAQTDGLFDVSLGSGRWTLAQEQGTHHLIRLDDATRLDLGGLAKGWAVDHALQAALQEGAGAAWINAGGDVKVSGVTLPVVLRHEASGGVQPWAELSDGAMATSDFRHGARSQLSGTRRAGHVSVAAPQCASADALTKVVALYGSITHPLVLDLLKAHQAQAWIHHEAP